MKPAILAAALSLAAVAAQAEGDPEKGARDFGKCRSCHLIANGDEVIQKGGKTGPNLYGVIGRPAASVEGFRYGEGITHAGEKGLVWDEENLTEYLADPTAFIHAFTGEKLNSKMTFKLKDGADVAAYLATFSDEDSE